MIKCNVTICGVVSKAATCRTSQDGRPYVCFAMNVVIPAKTGIRSATSGDACQSKNKTVEVSVIKDGTLTEVGNPLVGSRIEVAGILTLKKRGDNLYFNLSATGINLDTTATDDCITGQMEFRGKTGKQIGIEYVIFTNQYGILMQSDGAQACVAARREKERQI